MKIRSLNGALLVCMLVASNANATVLDFSGLGLSNYDSIPQSYGDNIGDTLNISVSYDTTHATESVEYWSTDYGDLIDVAFSGAQSDFASITFTSEIGYDVTLNSFDFAGYFQADLALESLQILSGNGTTLWDSGVALIHGAGPTHDSFSPNISSSDSLSIVWGTNWNIGIDNINFSQSNTGDIPVPAPFTLMLFGLGLAGLGAVRRNRIKQP